MKKYILAIMSSLLILGMNPGISMASTANTAPVQVKTAVNVKTATVKAVAKKKAKKKVVLKKKKSVKAKKPIVYKVNPWKSVKMALPRDAFGKVIDIDTRAHQIIVDMQGSKQILQITPDTVITRDGMAIGLEEVKIGESVQSEGQGQFTQTDMITAKKVNLKSASL